MSGRFAVPLSSSPPSTPDSRRSSRGRPNAEFSNLFPHPSTTPAGPPPSSTNSFTPAGAPPPSSIFGSSPEKSGKQLFGSKSTSTKGLALHTDHQGTSTGLKKAIAQPWDRNANTSLLGSTPLKSHERGRTFAVPDPSSPTDALSRTDDEDERSEGSWAESDGENDDAHLDLRTNGKVRFDSTTLTMEPDLPTLQSSITNGFLPKPGGTEWARSDFGSSIDAASPRSAKRLRESNVRLDISTQQRPPAKRQKRDSALPSIIQNMARNMGTAKLHESDHLILETESWMGTIYRAEALPEDGEKAVEDVIPSASKGLCDLWRTGGDKGEQDTHMEDEVVIGIGPGEDESTLQKATFIAPLLLQLHHPPPLTGKQAFASSRTFRMTQYTSERGPSQPPKRPTPLPKVLHDWLHNYHNPYGSAIVDLQTHHPNPTAHINYWDALFNMLLRGKIFNVVQTFKMSNFQYARTAREESGSDGYQGAVLENIKILVSRMASIFEECPMLQEENWNVTGNDWSVFRKRIAQALAELTVFVEGEFEERERIVPEIEAPHFGLGSNTSSLAQSVRDAERKIPLIIYENLRTMYGIVLGKTPEIVSSAQDWVEATLSLTIWWDGEDDDGENLAASFSQSRRSIRRSRIGGDRTVDLNPIAAYGHRVAAAFERVTDDDDPDLFQINTNNSVEVGLASVFEGNVEGVISLLHGWSLPVSSAVAEIANLAGWLRSSSGPGKVTGFNQSDLMVLSYGQQEQGLTSDSILIDYADELFKRDSLKHVARKNPLEGWELSMQILSRLDDEELGIKKLSELLQQLPLTSDKRVDKLLHLCLSFGLDREAFDIAERYADHFTNDTDSYGNAIIYYARARRSNRVKNVLDLLISLSLVESRAFPPSTSLDDNLRALVESPKESLAALANLDPDAAQLIHLQLTGYASLRKFYDLRDEGVRPKQGQHPTLRPMARRKIAISTLIAVINSAADNIHGGLYDPKRASIVPVDGLLALLGEATVFIDQPERELTLPQCLDLLKAIEDLQTATSRVYGQCEECFRCTLTNGQPQQRQRQQQQGQQKRPDAREMLKKSISNVTSSSSAFSLIESSMMMGSETRESTGSEGVMVNMLQDAGGSPGDERGEDSPRGWDWRRGVSADASGAELLRMMRLGLAKDIARAWVEGEEL
ncbi:MAG: hypothetical protein Q9197_002133 [Variospora fuerteventurae]